MADDNLSKHFGSAVENIMLMMLESEAIVGEAIGVDPAETRYDVSCVIGFAGDMQGVTLLGMSKDTAKRIAAKLVEVDESEFENDESELADAIGEFANIIIGGAKSRLGRDVSITYPCVIIADKHITHRPSHVPTFRILCETDFGPFSIEYTIQKVSGDNAKAA